MFFEICVWWCFYLFSVTSTGEVINWSLIGPVLLTLLIEGSTCFTESLSKEKYPAYAIYQQTTSKIFLWFPSSPKI